MLFDVSYKDLKIEAEIESIVGKKFNLIERLKLGGIGSQKLVVEKANLVLMEKLNSQSSANFSNIELRKKGVVIWFRIKLHVWVLVMPYYQLTIYKSQNSLTLHSNNWKINFSPAYNRTLKLSFVKKIMIIRHKQKK